PLRRPRDLAIGELRLELRHSLIELLARRERAALLGGPGTELRVARPGGEVGVGLLIRERLDPAPPPTAPRTHTSRTTTEKSPPPAAAGAAPGWPPLPDAGLVKKRKPSG